MRARQPSILDVVRAVKAAAAAHSEVGAWWYAPPQRMRLLGDRPKAEASRALEVAVECPPDDAATAPDFARISSELSRALAGATVNVRAYRGLDEPRHLFRLISRQEIGLEA